MTLAEEGNELAADELLRTLTLPVEWLKHLARKRPSVFRRIAAQKMYWPMIWSSHPEIVRENKAFAEYLKLGSGVGINFSQPGKPFSLKAPANKVTIHLFRLAQALRRGPIEDWRNVYDYMLLDPVIQVEGGRKFYDPQQLLKLEAWGRHADNTLPLFSRATAPKWKPEMRDLFWLVYGKAFDEHPDLKELKQSVIGHAKDIFGRQGPGVVRQAMLRKVLQALNSVAPLD